MKGYEYLAAYVLQLVFVAEALEFGPLRDELRVLLLEVPLLVHHPRYLLRHHLRHLVAHVRLQHRQVGELLQTL